MKVKVKREQRFGAHTYKVQYTPNLLAVDKFAGRADHHKMLIEIDPILNDSRKAEVLCHENLHIWNNNYCIGLDEDNICRLSECFADFLLNNLGIELDWSDIPNQSP